MLSFRQWQFKRRFARAVLRFDDAARNDDEVIDLGPEAVEPLISALRARSAKVRSGAAWALGWLGDHRLQDPRAERALVNALGDRDGQVRYQAAEALSHFRNPKSIDALIRVLDDRNSSFRATAARSLGALRDPRAVPSLIAALNDTDRLVREAAARSLGALRDPRAVPSLITALNDTDRLVRKAAVESLGCFTDPAGIQALVARLPFEDCLYDILGALSRVGEPAVEFLIPVLRDPRPACRRGAAHVLGEIADRRALEPLLGILGDPDVEVAKTAMRSLLLLGGHPPLSRLLDRLAALDREDAKFARRLEVAIVDAAPEPEIPRLSEQELRRLAALEDVRFAWASCNFGDSHSCDFHLVRQRARQELVRRGLEA